MASKWIAHKCMSPSLLHQMSQPPAAERSFEGIRPGPCSSKILYAAVDSGTDISMEISSPTPHGTCCWISIWLQNGIRVRFRSQACASPQPSRSEEHTSELQSLLRISYAVFCLNKKKLTCRYYVQ